MDSVFSEKDEALCKAVDAGDLNAVVDLVEAGAQINAFDADGFSPLMLAAFRGNRDMAEFLIGMGADVNLANSHGVVPLHYAAYQGDMTMCEMLFMNGAQVDAPIYDGLSWVPLHCAAFSGKPDTFEFLLGAGASPLIRDAEGYLPHQVAIRGSETAKLIEAKVFPMLPAPDRDQPSA